MQATETPTKKLAAEFKRAERASAELEARLDRNGHELRQLSAELSAAGIDIADLSRHEQQLALKTADANQALKRQTAALEKMDAARRNSAAMRDISGKAAAAGAGMIGAGLAVGLPVANAVQQAMTLETAMADVRKVVDGLETPEAFAKMSDDILDISTRIPMSAEGIASIVAAAGRANVPREELLRFAEDAAKMGVAFETTAEQAGESMAKWRTAFGLGQDGVVALADQINALTNTYGGNVAAVSDMVTRIGPLGKVGGLAAAEIAAMSQVLSSVGVESEVGATGIKNLMLALTNGTAATKMQRQAFADLGLDAEALAKAMQHDAAGAITDVLARIQRLPAEAQAGTLTRLFGSESVAAIAPMLTSLDQLRTNFAMVGDRAQYAGSMNKEYLAATATTAGASGLAGNALKALNITMGQMLLPTVVEVAAIVGHVAGALRGWAKEHPLLAKGIMMFLGVGALLLILLGGLSLAFAAVTAAAAPLGLALAPILLIVAAIAGLAAAAYLIYTHWDGIVAYVSGIWAEIREAAGAGIGSIIEMLINFSPVGLIWRAMSALLRYLGFDVPGRLTDAGRAMVDGIITGITGRIAALQARVSAMADGVADTFRRALGIQSPSRVFALLGGHVMAGLDRGLAAGAGEPLRRITDLSGQMVRALAIGAGGAALASGSSGVAGPRAPSDAITSPAAIHNYTINITASGGQPQDIAEAVRRAIEQMERDRRGRQFGDD